MKPNKTRLAGPVLSLKKTTVARLNSTLPAAAGGANRTTAGQDIPETCGYACTDCMSLLTKPFTIPVTIGD